MSSVVERIRSVGVTAAGRGGVEVVRNKYLQMRYGFDAWHVGAPYHLKPYKRLLVEAVSKGEPGTVVEVGCGLGDVISRVSCDRALGVDQEAAVVEAAARLHPGVQFVQGQLSDLAAVLPADVDAVDVLVMVNWPHLIPFDEIRESLAGLVAGMPVGRVVMDGIHPDEAGYAHRHSPGQMASLGEVMDVLPDIDAVRDLYTIVPFGSEARA